MALRYQLDNGLTVVFEEQHAARVAAFQIWVKVGSADERRDQAGLAHLHEHMLFKGTSHRGPGEIAQEIEAHGGEINAWTSYDQTVYHIVIGSSFADRGLSILSDAVRHSTFDPGELSRESEVVCEEIKRSEDMPSRRASRDLFSTAYQVHPYQYPVIGSEASVRSFTRDSVLAFYHRYYTPKNMVLSVAGDLTESQLRQWVDENLAGDWKRPFDPIPARPKEPLYTAPRIHLRSDPDVKEAYLNIGFQIPSIDHPDVAALDVLAMIAGQGDTSKLVREIKRRQHWVNEIHAYAYTPKDSGLWAVSATLQPAHLKDVVEETARILEYFRHTLVQSDELSTVQALMESEAIYQRETVQGLARKLGFYESMAGGIEREALYYQRVAQLKPETLMQAAERYLHLDKCVVTALFPDQTDFTEGRVNQAIADALKKPAHPDLNTPRAVRRSLDASPVLKVFGRSQVKNSPKILVEKLTCGASLLIRQETAVPLFAIRAAFQGGLRAEQARDNGVSVLTARLLTRGTPEQSAEDIARRMDELSGSMSGNAGRNSVGLRGEFLSRHFEEAFDLFSESLLHPTFIEKEFLHEQSLQLQDIHTREDKPAGVAFELFSQAMYPRHPYGLPIGGSAESVKALTPDALKAYHRSTMDPSRMTLCVVGDVDVDQVRALAEKAFLKSAPSAPASSPPALDSPSQGPQEIRKILNKAQAHLVLGFKGAKLTDSWKTPLELVSSILSGQGGRLFMELRDKRSMAYSVTSYSVEGVDPGYFAVYMATSPEKVEAALGGIREELTRIYEQPVSPAELERAKQNLIGSHEIALQRNGARAAILALDHCYGLGLDAFYNYAAQVSAVTAAEVQQVARQVIRLDQSVQAWVGP